MSRHRRSVRRDTRVAAVAVAALLLSLLFTSGHKARHSQPRTPPVAGATAPGDGHTPRPSRPAAPPGATGGSSQPSSGRSDAAPTSSHGSLPRLLWTFDAGASGWTGGSSTALTAVHSPARTGAGALAVQNTGSGPATLVASSGSGPATWTPAHPQTRWFGRVDVRAQSHSRAVHVTVAFLDGYGRPLAQAAGQGLWDHTGDWRRTYTAVGITPPATAYAVLRVTIDSTSPGETHYLDNAALAEYPAGAPAVVGPLRTSGTRIVDGNGRTLVFRGLNRVGLEGTPGTHPPTPDDIVHAHAWGANVIRLPLNDQFWLASSCHQHPNYPAEVDNAVQMVTSLGMVAMLDLHWNALTPCGSYSQQPMAEYPGALTFWHQVAARYKKNPLVAFDLYNEPHDISDDVWRSGGLVRWQGSTFRAAGMQQMYGEVRATGATNLVVASGNSWGNLWPTTAPLSGSNVVYGVHAYTCPAQPPPHCANAAPYSPSQYFRFWAAAAERVPIAVTEFGWPNPGDGRFMSAVIDYAEQQHWGWLAFTWGAASWGPFTLLADAGPGRAYEPAPTGQVVLAALPGG